MFTIKENEKLIVFDEAAISFPSIVKEIVCLEGLKIIKI